MKNIVKAILPLLITSLIFTTMGCSIQNITDDNEQASSDNFMNPILPKEEQRYNDENDPIRIKFGVISVESIQDNLDLTDDCVYFSWMDFITPEQLEIAREYLEIPEGVFDDNALVVYALTMDRELLRHYDRIPFEDMPEDPERIVVRMYEAYIFMNLEIRKKSALELGIIEPDYIIPEFGRVITDWR